MVDHPINPITKSSFTEVRILTDSAFFFLTHEPNETLFCAILSVTKTNKTTHILTATY